jgi:hypothetical protein
MPANCSYILAFIIVIIQNCAAVDAAVETSVGSLTCLAQSLVAMMQQSDKAKTAPRRPGLATTGRNQIYAHLLTAIWSCVTRSEVARVIAASQSSVDTLKRLSSNAATKTFADGILAVMRRKAVGVGPARARRRAPLQELPIEHIFQ